MAPRMLEFSTFKKKKNAICAKQKKKKKREIHVLSPQFGILIASYSETWQLHCVCVCVLRGIFDVTR